MFIAAAAKTFAKRTGREFVGLVYTDVARDFPPMQQQTIMRNVPYVHRADVAGFTAIPHGGYLCNGFPNTNAEDVLLQDFFQDARCIDPSIALELFAPYREILDEISSTYGDVSEMVAVNVRRGDYLLRNNQQKGFRVLKEDEIRKILMEFFPDDEVLFISDDIDWCKSQFHGDRFHFADRPCRYKPEMDLYLQTQTRANIISNSTFSWWGAYLNEWSEKVICPWPWFHSGKINPMTHILPDYWIKW